MTSPQLHSKLHTSFSSFKFSCFALTFTYVVFGPCMSSSLVWRSEDNFQGLSSYIVSGLEIKSRQSVLVARVFTW